MSTPKYLVAIFGGAVSGSEAAHQLSLRGIPSVVFDQNALPYGKIEDGLPKWHVKLRDKEIRKINEKLNDPLVTFVPQTSLGEDVHFTELVDWGFSAILLAIGAWCDRPLAVEGVDAFVGKGLVYQNPFIYWFNHKHEPNYQGEHYEIKDEVAIIGGGLASLDVAKVIMFELVQKALEERGHKVDLFKLDRSISKVLNELDLTLDDLGIKGCTLYYRRRIKDMPLSPLPTDTPEKLQKAQNVREKILNNYRSKYLFNMAPCHLPTDPIVEDGQLVGLKMLETEIVEGKVVPIDGSDKEVRFPYVISSIGSIPAKVPGIPASGQTYQVEDETFCRIKGFDNVFALGNAVTGRGNIKESMEHGREISQNVIEGYLPEGEGDPHHDALNRIADAINVLEESIHNHKITPEAYGHVMEEVAKQHQRTGYEGDFMAWIQTHLPQRLEDLLGVNH